MNVLLVIKKSLTTFWLLGLGSVHLCPGHYPSKKFQIFSMAFSFLSKTRKLRGRNSDILRFLSLKQRFGLFSMNYGLNLVFELQFGHESQLSEIVESQRSFRNHQCVTVQLPEDFNGIAMEFN